ncbi:HXXEE domain-containing protein [Streptococcus macacae]|uniref:HXXEE domain-containing protein n=1 Tax=Streptococcus macacae NCTC 11558 TaxID=764298 RepID=G5JXQ2_9STRE|nr:HXXEE domain-containing protein [Streptococcus macacae]EHJ53041.1 hypothetical protein STRMA_1676 [Streptococcus macacae NCTC 11558]SUN77609.1 Uncharacterised protein [Streptococcus macacae NCTC 11558]
MSIALFSLLGLSLFMIHEFDELILVKPWIAKQSENPNYQKELFIMGKKRYPSTESIAVMIGEEFLLASLLLALASYFSLPELAAAILIGHLLHLLSHIKEALQFHRFVPGSFTAVVTFPLLLFFLTVFLVKQPLNIILLLCLIPLVFLLLIGNLMLLQRNVQSIDKWIQKFVC